MTTAEKAESLTLADWLQSLKERKGTVYLAAADPVSAQAFLKENLRRAPEQLIHGLRTVSLADLAFPFAMQKLAAEGGSDQAVLPQRISSQEASLCLYRLLKEQVSQPDYFLPRECLGLSTAADICHQITQLRSGEPGARERLQKDAAFSELSRKRLNQVFALRDLFEASLRQAGLYDDTRLLQEALAWLQEHPEQGNLQIGVLETLLPQESTEPGCTWLETQFLAAAGNPASGGQVVRIRCLRELDSVLAQTQQENFFQAYGIVNEIRWCARCLAETQNYGQAEIFYPAAVYEPYLRAVLEGKGIPYSLLSARPALDSAPVQMLEILLDWAGHGVFLYEDLRPLFVHPGFTLRYYLNQYPPEQEEENIISHTPGQIFVRGIARHICWGLENYPQPEEEMPPVKNVREQESRALDLFLCELRQAFEQTGTAAELTAALGGLIEKVWAARPEELAAWHQLLHKADHLLRLLESGPDSEDKDLDSRIRKIRDTVERLGLSAPAKEGTVLLRRISGPLIVSRQEVWFLGLSSQNLMPSTAESPAVYDAEMAILLDAGHHSVRLAGSRSRELSLAVEKTIRSLPAGARVHFGSSVYDTFGQTEDSPSPLYYRLWSLGPGKEGKDMRQLPVHSYAQELAGGGKKTIFRCEAISKPEDSHRDPQKISYSPSSFQTLMQCPKHFYFNKICEIPEEEYADYDSLSWPPASARGNFFHALMRDYCQAVFLHKPEPERELQEDLYRRCFARAQKQLLQEAPCRFADVQENAMKQLEEDCRIYLQGMHEAFRKENNGPHWMVDGCEVSVQYTLHLDPEPGQADSPAYDLTFRGRIDRVDQRQDPDGSVHYRIIDYKTGRMDTLNRELQAEREVQHVIYPLAVEADHPGSHVDRAVYVFPMDRNGDQPKEIALTDQEIHSLSPQQRHLFHQVFDAWQFKYITAYGLDSPRPDPCQYCIYGQTYGICLDQPAKAGSGKGGR